MCALVVVVVPKPPVPVEDPKKLPWEEVVTKEEPSSAVEQAKSWDVRSGDSTAKGSSIVVFILILVRLFWFSKRGNGINCALVRDKAKSHWG